MNLTFLPHSSLREGREGEERIRVPQLGECVPAVGRLCVCLCLTDADDRSCSGGLLGCTQQEETQQVQHHQDQNQAN